WVGRALLGDFGHSYFFKERVASLIARRMPVTITLGLVGLSLALLISIPLGIVAALRENTWLDRAVTMFTMIGQAVPSTGILMNNGVLWFDPLAGPTRSRPASGRSPICCQLLCVTAASHGSQPVHRAAGASWQGCCSCYRSSPISA